MQSSGLKAKNQLEIVQNNENRDLINTTSSKLHTSDLKDNELVSERSSISKRSIISRRSVRKNDQGNSANSKPKMLRMSAKAYERGVKTARRVERANDLNRTQPIIKELEESPLVKQQKKDVEVILEQVPRDTDEAVTSQDQSKSN